MLNVTLIKTLRKLSFIALVSKPKKKKIEKFKLPSKTFHGVTIQGYDLR